MQMYACAFDSYHSLISVAAYGCRDLIHIVSQLVAHAFTVGDLVDQCFGSFKASKVCLYAVKIVF